MLHNSSIICPAEETCLRKGTAFNKNKKTFHVHTRVYPKVSGPPAWRENYKWYSSLPLGAVVSTFCESASQRMFIVVISLSTQSGNFWVHPRILCSPVFGCYFANSKIYEEIVDDKVFMPLMPTSFLLSSFSLPIYKVK
jgi:hypothetical protein